MNARDSVVSRLGVKNGQISYLIEAITTQRTSAMMAIVDSATAGVALFASGIVVFSFHVSFNRIVDLASSMEMS